MDQTGINREKTMERESPVEIKTDKSDHDSGSAVCKRNTRLKCKKCGVKLHHDKGAVRLMCIIRTCKNVYT